MQTPYRQIHSLQWISKKRNEPVFVGLSLTNSFAEIIAGFMVSDEIEKRFWFKLKDGIDEKYVFVVTKHNTPIFSREVYVRYFQHALRLLLKDRSPNPKK